MFDYLLGGEQSNTWKNTGKDDVKIRRESKRETAEDEEEREKTLLLGKTKNILMYLEVGIDAVFGKTPLKYIFCSYHPRELLFSRDTKHIFPERWIQLLGYDKAFKDKSRDELKHEKMKNMGMNENEATDFIDDRNLCVKVRAINNISNIFDLVTLSWLSYLTGESKYRKVSKKAILENQWNSVGILSALMATIAIEMATLASDSDYDEDHMINQLYVFVWLGSFTALIISTCCAIMLIVATGETADDETFEVFINILDGIFYGASVLPFFYFYIGGVATMIGTVLYPFVFFYELQTSIICLLGVFMLGFFYCIYLLCVTSALQCTNQTDKFLQIHYPKCTDLSIEEIKKLLKDFIAEKLHGRIENLGADIADTDESLGRFADEFLEYVSLREVIDSNGNVRKKFGCDLSYVLKERARILFTEYVRKSCFVENLSVDTFYVGDKDPIDVMSRK